MLNHMLRGKRLGKRMRKSCGRKEGAGSPAQSVLPPHSPPSLACSEPSCNFVGQAPAGLVNHARQRHAVPVQVRGSCPHCGGQYWKQGLPIHISLCHDNLAHGE